MLRGFITGALSGGALGLGVATVATVLAPPPQPPEVSDSAPGAAQAPSAIDELEAGTTARDPQASAPDVLAKTTQSAPTADTLVALSGDATAPGSVPQTGDAAGLAAPAQVTETDTLSARQDDPVLPNPLALAPMTPQPADELSISTEPAQPPLPEPVQEETAFAAPEVDTTEPVLPAPQVQSEVSNVVAPEPEDETVTATLTPQVDDATAPDVIPQSNDAPQAEAQDPPPEGVTGDDSQRADQSQEQAPAAEEVLAVDEQTPDQDEDVRETAEATEQSPQGDPTLPETPVQDPAPSTDAQESAPVTETAQTVPAEPSEPAPDAIDPADAEEPETQTAMIAPTSRPQIGTPAVSLTERSNNSGVSVRRPTTEAAQTQETPVPDADITETAAASGDPRPIGQFAQAFENPEAKPLMSIVLIDTGEGPTSGAPGIAALRSFPYALSFAIDATLPDAAERMALYRAEGFEVLAMVDLPEGAQASDAETTLNAVLAQLPEVMGVLEGTETGLQGAREASDQVTAILAETGHGLVTQSRGLNTMPKLARKEGVPATPIFRDFDGKDQSATVMRRFLDQAAFKAGQEGAVIMMGRLRPETITALLLWGLQDRAGQVALAPVSAILLSEEAG